MKNTITNTNEIWLPVKNWEDVYAISNFGNIKRIRDGIKKGGKKGVAGTLMNFSPDGDGYLQVKLSDGKKRKACKVHRLVAQAFIGEITHPLVVNHKDGNVANNAVSNLEIVTYSENNLHAYRILGRKPVSNKGESAGRAKLSNNQILEIRKIYKESEISQSKLAKQFGVHQTLISKIVNNKNWSHL